MMFQQKGALIFVAVLALSFSIHSISACQDYGDNLCLYVNSNRAGNTGWSCSRDLDVDTLIVNVDGRNIYHHCKSQQQSMMQGEDIPKPPPPPSGQKTMAAESDYKSQLIARILSAIGFEDTVSAQSCQVHGGQSLCLYISTRGRGQWFCSYDSNVRSLQVQYPVGQNVYKCN